MLFRSVQKAGPTALVSTGTHYFAYDAGGRLIGECDANLDPLFETVYFGAVPIAVIKYTKTGTRTVTWSTSISYVCADHLATPRVIVRTLIKQSSGAGTLRRRMAPQLQTRIRVASVPSPSTSDFRDSSTTAKRACFTIGTATTVLS